MRTKMNRAFMLFIILLIENSSEAQLNSKTFDKTIYVPASEIRMDSLLRIFSRQTGVEFSFNSRKISPSRKVTVSRHKQSLSQWLTTLNNSLGIQHRIVGNHIILIDNDKDASGKISTSVSSTGKTTVVKNSPTSPTTKNITHQDPKAQEANRTLVNEQAQNGKVDFFRQVAERTLEYSSADVLVNPDSSSSSPIQSLLPAVNLTSGNVADKTGPKKRAVQFSGGYCRHRRNDSNYVREWEGLSFGGEYIQYVSRKFSLSYNFRATINSGQEKSDYLTGAGPVEGTVRFTTAGIQVGVNGGLSLVNSAKHEFRINLGPFVRYQSASNGSENYGTYGPSSTGINAVLFEFYNETPQNTIAVGGILLLQYNYTFKSNVFVGAQTGYQTDTNRDAVLHVGGLVVGKRF